ncbi:MAG: hypothetical protein WCB87_03280, partial [Methanoregula sp.]|uniref:hypothetical protein n=1 Tax=Methanoregula sp. TaxID=2052170 RepID=UPI003C792C5D
PGRDAAGGRRPGPDALPAHDPLPEGLTTPVLRGHFYHPFIVPCSTVRSALCEGKTGKRYGY